jgi:hypothetical protein
MCVYVCLHKAIIRQRDIGRNGPNAWSVSPPRRSSTQSGSSLVRVKITPTQFEPRSMQVRAWRVFIGVGRTGRFDLRARCSDLIWSEAAKRPPARLPARRPSRPRRPAGAANAYLVGRRALRLERECVRARPQGAHRILPLPTISPPLPSPFPFSSSFPSPSPSVSVSRRQTCAAASRLMSAIKARALVSSLASYPRSARGV